ncbi:MAG: CopD family protein [Proteobacteria bacterium]|nr:CopD family protein [Pseudomonadota bacterium]
MYLWFKWIHILAVISWMCGILYLYRLLINHRERGTSSPDNHELLKGMEYRLYRYITRPAMLVSIAAGSGMIWLNPEMLNTGWLQVKLLAVVLLIVSTLYASHLNQVAAVNPTDLPSSKNLRWANEGPTILMMIIVWMVVFKSF